MRRLFVSSILALVLVSGSFARAPHPKIVFPNTPDYLVLKGDFHTHTIFSDATVWPAVRVQEAAMEGLDVIAITDHIEYRPRKEYILGDHNKSYEIARPAGKAEDVLVLRGSEITRDMPPGHWNAVFIKDANKLDTPEYMDAFKEARSQGAFIFWNHPGWERQAPNETVWLPEHEKLYIEGYMMGIEVFNPYEGYSKEAFQWALDRNLTIMCNTDCHSPMDQLFDYFSGEHRCVTLLLAKERTAKGVREALENRRTAAYAQGNIYGREEVVKPLFESVVTIEKVVYKDKRVSFVLCNNSSMTVIMRKGEGSEAFMFSRSFRLRPGEKLPMAVTPVDSATSFDKLGSVTMNLVVENFWISPEQNLKYSFSIAKND